MSVMGRPTKLDRARMEGIPQAIRDGNTWENAARLNKIGYRTIHEWRSRGRVDLENDVDSPYAELVAACDAAEAEFEDELIQIVREAGKQDRRNWAAAMTFLERRYPDRYGRRDTLNVDAENPLVTLNILSDPNVREQANAFLRSIASPGPIESSGPSLVLESTEVRDNG